MPAKKTKGKPPRKGKHSGKTVKEIKEEAKKAKQKTVTYYLPVPVNKAQPEEPISPEEISYKESLIAARIEELAAKGLSDTDIIKALDISRTQFYVWLKEKPHFAYSLLKYRELAHVNVENALYNNAIGYVYQEQAATASGKVVTILKQRLPETKAQTFYLTNRRSAQWKNKVEQVHEIGQGLSAITFSIKRYEE